jgi:predicted transcriptional regulator
MFGPLELRVLESLWACAAPAAVRDLQPAFPGVAYTTLMTTLDRLFRKGVLDRQKHGRAFAYQPRLSRSDLQSHLATSVLTSLLPARACDARPFLSFLVEAVADRDGSLLDELESLVRARREALRVGK